MSATFDCVICDRSFPSDGPHVELMATRMIDGQPKGRKVIRSCKDCGQRLIKGRPMGELEHAIARAEASPDDEAENKFVHDAARAVWMFCCRFELIFGAANPSAQMIAKKIMGRVRDHARSVSHR